jgi:hypothetical protein
MAGVHTPDRYFIDWIRHMLGKEPLYPDKVEDVIGVAGYLEAEALCKLASPECTTCGGYGYFDGEVENCWCPCTGLSQISARRRARVRHMPRDADPQRYGVKG